MTYPELSCAHLREDIPANGGSGGQHHDRNRNASAHGHHLSHALLARSGSSAALCVPRQKAGSFWSPTRLVSKKGRARITCNAGGPGAIRTEKVVGGEAV